MKKCHFLFILILTILFLKAGYGQNFVALEKNKAVSVIYHQLKAENVDVILSDNFVGRNEKSRHFWNKEDHRKYLSNGRYKEDSIFFQIAEGNWVATRFVRTGLWQGDTVIVELMQFKRFENGKIAEIWEYGDSKQVETEKKQ